VKKTLTLIFVVVTVIACLSACGSRGRQLADDVLAGMILPFSGDGTFIITQANYDEHGRIGTFWFGEHQVWYTGRTQWISQYFAGNFQSYATDFISLMNSITPVLVDAVTVDSTRFFENPFRVTARSNTLYAWMHFDRYIQMVSTRMFIYQIDGFGYLRFTLSGWEYLQEAPYSLVRSDALTYHSLYRISLYDLDRISMFAEGLTRVPEEAHGHVAFTRNFMRGVAILGTSGLLVAIRGFVLIFINRSADPMANISVTPEEQSEKRITRAKRRFLAKAFHIPAGLLTAICAFYWRIHGIGVRPTRISYESLFWVAGAYIVIVAVLGVFAVAYLDYSKRFRK